MKPLQKQTHDTMQHLNNIQKYMYIFNELFFCVFPITAPFATCNSRPLRPTLHGYIVQNKTDSYKVYIKNEQETKK